MHTAQAGEAVFHRFRPRGSRDARGYRLVIYFILGPDRFLGRQSALAIANDLDPEGANTSWLDGREVSLDRLTAAVGTVSFFGEPRVVIVSDLLARAGRDAGFGDAMRTEDDRQPRGHPPIESLIAAVPEQHHLILFEPSLTAVPAALRSAAPAARIIASEPPRGRALIAWIEERADQSGTRIDRRSAQHLAETLFPQTWDRKPPNPRYDRPPDLALLSQEVEKLALAAHPGPITVEHILEHIPGGADQRMFRFLDAALGGDLRAALGELGRLTVAGEEPAMLLAQLLSQVELSTVAAAASGKDAESVARDLGTVAPARMSAVMVSARRQPPRSRSAVAQGAMTDRNLKTGRARKPEDALHDFVLALATDTAERNTGRSE